MERLKNRAKSFDYLKLHFHQLKHQQCESMMLASQTQPNV